MTDHLSYLQGHGPLSESSLEIGRIIIRKHAMDRQTECHICVFDVINGNLPRQFLLRKVVLVRDNLKRFEY
uniref:Uncharacterized protein n=1 Tax=Heterorhabditis bacteriophora TaxID=37862 RepID=A0A1I7WK96_HETBA